MSVNTRVEYKIEAAKLEIETLTETKLDDIKAGHTKKIDSLEMKISDITSTNNY